MTHCTQEDTQAQPVPCNQHADLCQQAIHKGQLPNCCAGYALSETSHRPLLTRVLGCGFDTPALVGENVCVSPGPQQLLEDPLGLQMAVQEELGAVMIIRVMVLSHPLPRTAC